MKYQLVDDNSLKKTTDNGTTVFHKCSSSNMGYSEIEQIIYKAIATAARAQGIDDETIIITNSSDVGDYTDAYVTIQSAEMEALSDKDLAQVLYRLQTCIDNTSGTNIIILVYFKTIDMKYTYNFQTFGATDEQGLYKNSNKIYPLQSQENTIQLNNPEDTENNNEKIEESVPLTDDGEKATCCALVEKAVKNQLKSPSSAKFPFTYNSDGVSMFRTGSTIYVVGWVEAENSFGATLRSDFAVTIEKNGSGKTATYSVTECAIG